jgi:hypothetical protein
LEARDYDVTCVTGEDFVADDDVLSSTHPTDYNDRYVAFCCTDTITLKTTYINTASIAMVYGFYRQQDDETIGCGGLIWNISIEWKNIE